MPKKPTEIEIMEKYQREHNFPTASAFADALGISRQKLGNWYADVNKPTTELLQFWSLLYTLVPPLWVSQMAVELLRIRDEKLIPCTCEKDAQGEITENNPYCPRHMNVEEITTQ